MIEWPVREAAERMVAGPIESPLSFVWEPVGGGSINNTYRIRSSSRRSGPSTYESPGQWFCKVNTVADFPEMFEKEVQGLRFLENRGGMRVPGVIGQAVAAGYQLLVLEWIEPERSGLEAARDKAFWTRFGETLACMHQVSDTGFGHEVDNYMGAFPQSNTRSDSWTDFFREERLEPQVRMAFNQSLLKGAHLTAFEKLYRRLPEIFPEEPPALLHGDLWCGNFLRAAGGQPVLIDPAVYFGHRSMDLAMTTLFGGFDPLFYEAYQDRLPFPDNYSEQEIVCNLYPLLIHLNLFGPGYLPDIEEGLKMFS